jgi:hypothetical protein
MQSHREGHSSKGVGNQQRTTVRLQPAERMFLQTLVKDLGGASANDAVRWAIRMAHGHIHSQRCAQTSHCLSVSMAVLGRPAVDQLPAPQTSTDEATDGGTTDDRPSGAEGHA